MKLSQNQKLGVGAIAAWFAFSWFASRVASAAVTAGTDAVRDAAGDAWDALGETQRSIFEAWLSVYEPPLETATAALQALSDVATAPSEMLAEAWAWWRGEYDPEGATPVDPDELGGQSDY